MKLTARTRAAVTALADLAAHQSGGPIPLAEIGARQRLSVAFLEQIFPKLRRAGLVESHRGAGGGYSLALAAEDITPAAIVRAIDEEIRSTACVPGSSIGCTGTSARCLTHGLWAELDRQIETYLDSVTLKDLAGQAELEAAPFSAVEAARA